MGADPTLIRQQIARTRDAMGETIDAIAYKADIRARTKERVGDTVGRARETVSGKATTIREAVGGTVASIKDSTHLDSH